MVSMVHVSPRDGHVDDEQANTPETTRSLSPGTRAQCWHPRQTRLRIPVTVSPGVDHDGVGRVRNERDDENVEHRATK